MSRGQIALLVGAVVLVIAAAVVIPRLTGPSEAEERRAATFRTGFVTQCSRQLPVERCGCVYDGALERAGGEQPRLQAALALARDTRSVAPELEEASADCAR